MTSILLDTSAYAAFMRGHGEIVGRTRESEAISLNPIVLGELKAGFRKGAFRKRNEQELTAFLESDRVSVLAIDSETSERYAAILESLWEAGTPIPTNDLWIAASAMQHGIRIVTTDRHFLKVKQVLVDFYPAA